MLLQHKVLLKNKEFLCLFSGIGANGAAFYAYVMTTLPKFEEMERDFESKKSGINVFAYGQVVECGLGAPPEEVKQRLEREYGFTHDDAA